MQWYTVRNFVSWSRLDVSLRRKMRNLEQPNAKGAGLWVLRGPGLRLWRLWLCAGDLAVSIQIARKNHNDPCKGLCKKSHKMETFCIVLNTHWSLFPSPKCHFVNKCQVWGIGGLASLLFSRGNGVCQEPILNKQKIFTTPVALLYHRRLERLEMPPCPRVSCESRLAHKAYTLQNISVHLRVLCSKRQRTAKKNVVFICLWWLLCNENFKMF